MGTPFLQNIWLTFKLGSEVRNCSLSALTDTASSMDAAVPGEPFIPTSLSSSRPSGKQVNTGTSGCPNTAFSEVATGSTLDTMKWISRSNKVYQSNSTWCKKHHLTNIYIFFKVFYPTRNWKSWGEGLEWITKYYKLKWELRGFQCPPWRLQKGAAISKQWSGKILDGRN